MFCMTIVAPTKPGSPNIWFESSGSTGLILTFLVSQNWKVLAYLWLCPSESLCNPALYLVKDVAIPGARQSTALELQASRPGIYSVSENLEDTRVELCGQRKRSSYLLLATTDFDFLTRVALAAIVASTF